MPTLVAILCVDGFASADEVQTGPDGMERIARREFKILPITWCCGARRVFREI
jgi:hypothetical protein